MSIRNLDAVFHPKLLRLSFLQEGSLGPPCREQWPLRVEHGSTIAGKQLRPSSAV